MGNQRYKSEYASVFGMAMSAHFGSTRINGQLDAVGSLQGIEYGQPERMMLQFSRATKRFSPCLVHLCYHMAALLSGFLSDSGLIGLEGM